jgi:hypothetical protein
MDSWEIGTQVDPLRCVDDRNFLANPSRSTGLSTSSKVEFASRKRIHFEITKSDDWQSDCPIGRVSQFSQYKVWRKWGTVATAHLTWSASKGGNSIRTTSADAIKGDTLIHGPRLVAQSVGSEWRIHRLHEICSQSIQTKGDRTK